VSGQVNFPDRSGRDRSEVIENVDADVVSANEEIIHIEEQHEDPRKNLKL
jgi:hypothetical protein